METIRVLLIEDNPGDTRLIKEMLKESHNIEYLLIHIDDIKHIKQIDENDFDIVLLDLNFNETKGLKSYKLASKYIDQKPIVVLTGLNDDELGYEIVKSGAQDYLIKGEIDNKTLTRSIRYAVERKKSQKLLIDAKGKNRKLRKTATFFRQESKRLSEINRTKDEFISLASHQLRTPATAVKQYIGLIMEGYAGRLNRDQISFLKKANESNERQLNIVNDILSVARLDGSNTKLALKECNIIPIIKDAINSTKTKFRDKKQKLIIDIPKRPILAEVDYAQLRIAIENLLENASNYSDKGKNVKICLNTGPQKIEIQVIDEGVGIAQEDIKKLFKKFSRVPNRFSIESGGTGLGLYWSQKMIKMHGGSIKVKSKLNEGSTFTLSLPIAEENQSYMNISNRNRVTG